VLRVAMRGTGGGVGLTLRKNGTEQNGEHNDVVFVLV
jgi:hypothetical protein